jgi:hypothetical protein
MLENLAHRLESQHSGAVASLREGVEETLTVMRLDLPKSLERVLSSTNLIEKLNVDPLRWEVAEVKLTHLGAAPNLWTLGLGWF